MGKVLNGGFTIFGGFHISNKALAIVLAGGIIGAAVGSKFIGQRPIKISANAKAFATDTDINNVKDRIITLISRNAANPGEVNLNMDMIVGKIAAYEPTLYNLIEERRNGSITREEFRRKIVEIVRTIMTEIGIAMRAKVPPINRTPDRLFELRDRFLNGDVPIPPGFYRNRFSRL